MSLLKVWQILFLISSLSASAKTLSPTSQEVIFRYTAEFQITSPKPPSELALQHAAFWYGYLQSPQIGQQFGLDPRIPGVGAPAWPVHLRVLSVKDSAGTQSIRYEATSRFLLHKEMTRALLKRGSWTAFLPYDLNKYFAPHCTDWPASLVSESDFWYFYNPFRDNCETLVNEPLARPVTITLENVESASSTLSAPLEELRGDNGNGELFEIVTVNGFDESSRDKSDGGRLAFDGINEWLENTLRFSKTEVQRYNNRPIYQFEKTMTTLSGEKIRVRITRLLAETEIRKRNVTFAKFFRRALEQADVTVFAGHSGADASVDLKEFERKSGPVQFDRRKLQLFFFDACSSYSYYLPMFDGQKEEGRLAVLSFGLPSEFGYELPMHKAFLRHLLNFKDNSPRWMEIMQDMERSLRGSTFLLTLSINSP